VGDTVGDTEGDAVGDAVGDTVGDVVGDAVGLVVGDIVGDGVGHTPTSYTRVYPEPSATLVMLGAATATALPSPERATNVPPLSPVLSPSMFSPDTHVVPPIKTYT
jgi:hypothetical protein